MFATPKLLEALAYGLAEKGTSIQEVASRVSSSGGTEFTPQWTRFCVEELLGGPPEESGVYMTPTYGNTLMGLPAANPLRPKKITRSATTRRSLERPSRFVDFNDDSKVVVTGETGRVKLTTMPRSSLSLGSWNAMKVNANVRSSSIHGMAVSGVRPTHVIRSTTDRWCILKQLNAQALSAFPRS